MKKISKDLSMRIQDMYQKGHRISQIQRWKASSPAPVTWSQLTVQYGVLQLPCGLHTDADAAPPPPHLCLPGQMSPRASSTPDLKFTLNEKLNLHICA
ncbi:hypothetical protein FKM82_025925 [Ascaphus truei]